MQLLITARDISVSRQGRTILRDVSIDIGVRDFITIIGPNGAGKSMFLKCLMGFYRPDSGGVQCKDGLKTGYVPQRLAPDNTMPIKAGRFITLRKKAGAETLERATKEAGAYHLLDRQLYTLSGGELQRVLLARALLDDPQLLILDEPAQNMDISGQLAFYKLLERIYEEREISILMVSHDLHMVMASTKRVICLFHHICCSGAPHMVAKDPEFISLFGNDMSQMLAIYHHEHSHTHEE